LALLASATRAAPVSEPACSLYAAPSGSDSNVGSIDRPYQSAQRLVDRLGAGAVGCLREGEYVDDVTFRDAGSAQAPIVLRSPPGESATILGRLAIESGANFVTIAYLNLDGRNEQRLPSPTVNGDDARFVGNDVTNRNTDICFDLGSRNGRVYRTVVEYNRIHDCGQLPATNLDHGIYVERAMDVEIVGNVIHDNADRGIQLYPDAQNTYVADNVIDGNGENVLIGGGEEPGGAWTSTGNVIEHNLITFSRERYNVEAHWAQTAGWDNVVRRNCIFGGARDGVNRGLAPDSGFTALENVLQDPLYENRDGMDFRLRPKSPCLDLANEGGETWNEEQRGPPPPPPSDTLGPFGGELAALSSPSRGRAVPPLASGARAWRVQRMRTLRARRALRLRARRAHRRSGARKRGCARCGQAFKR
jgi:parallel beta-helix repeat protein